MNRCNYCGGELDSAFICHICNKSNQPKRNYTGNIEPNKIEEVHLLPCPFCGGEAKEELQRGSWESYNIKNIYCQKCGANVSNREIWNKRI